jgi:hypothetical protein
MLRVILRVVARVVRVVQWKAVKVTPEVIVPVFPNVVMKQIAFKLAAGSFPNVVMEQIAFKVRAFIAVFVCLPPPRGALDHYR